LPTLPEKKPTPLTPSFPVDFGTITPQPVLPQKPLPEKQVNHLERNNSFEKDKRKSLQPTPPPKPNILNDSGEAKPLPKKLENDPYASFLTSPEKNPTTKTKFPEKTFNSSQ
jgi:hypothetical protein